MLAKFSYLAFGFIIGAGLLMAVTSFSTNNATLQKTGRLTGVDAPIGFQMERFG
ncbi:hypothetical protein QO002_002869 [Pararhizobium capsulatum DSM 1112]|uniref:Uncharacterized protein n=1 Tax=Pararhizobium capsulatum DSM 1112 TaxID=1121113 RepID=A0ABU0BR56_9HYPH|nr:hypothetical protein [Pararhizobium capsulatum]MDQ0320731.1 hypothetical protein [Pararhizobium capsulatum DSM 1112]